MQVEGSRQLVGIPSHYAANGRDGVMRLIVLDEVQPLLPLLVVKYVNATPASRELFSWKPRQQPHRPAASVTGHSLMGGVAYEHAALEIGGGNNGFVCSAAISTVRGSEHRQFFQQLESNTSSKQHARKSSQQKEIQGPTSVVA